MNKNKLISIIKESILKEEKSLLKEYTLSGGNYRDSYQHRVPVNNFANEEAKREIAHLLPIGWKSMNNEFSKRRIRHLNWTKKSEYNRTFVHVQYHFVKFNGDTYKIHQRQYYNHHQKDGSDGDANFTELNIMNVTKDEHLGTVVMDTKAYLRDIKNLEIINNG